MIKLLTKNTLYSHNKQHFDQAVKFHMKKSNRRSLAMYSFSRYAAVFIFIFSIAFTACSEENSEPLTFASDDSTGDAVKVDTGSASFYMIYAKSTGSEIVFPTGTTSGTSTMSRRFFISQTPVTNALYAAVLQWAYENNKLEVVSSTARYLDKALINLGSSSESTLKIIFSGTPAKFSVKPGYENHPVVNLSWHGAFIFCNWLTEMCDGNTLNVVYAINPDWSIITDNPLKTGYRLPYGDEWEYAARYYGTTVPAEGNLADEYMAQGEHGGSGSLTPGYYWLRYNYASGALADTSVNAETRAVAWFSGDPFLTGLMPVAQKRANHLGIYDMSGNAMEWCFDLYPGTSDRMMRMGSFATAAVPVSSYAYFDPQTFNAEVGFRIAKTK